MKKITGFIFLIMLISCNLYDNRKEEVLLTDKDYVENYREFSPNKSMILINYSLDLGAFGYGQCGTAILKMSDTTKYIRKFSLPSTLKEVKWIDDKNISGKIDIIPLIRNGEKIELKNTEINKIKVQISAFDYIGENSKLKVEYKETSPNGKYELLAYRYLSSNNDFSPIHISIIPYGDKVPKYGNYYIGEKQSDYVLNGNWNKENQLVFYSNEQDADFIQYYLVKNRPKIKYHITKDEKKYAGKYLWLK